MTELITDPKKLPDLDTPIVQQPECFITLPTQPPSHRIHVRPHPAGGWEWAHLLRAVAGWQVVAAGTLDGDAYPDAEAAAEYIATQARGATGDGFDRMDREAYTQKGSIAHIRREPGSYTGYCGEVGGPATFERTPGTPHAEQHCIKCDQAYRALHYGRTPVTY